ncbi:MAG TPA: extracellular solute-binding protein [Hyphomicrobiaceae bacterium]|nr:extracellular solute-binding protein [Hyphomicrobiaceae bacterium]
MMPSMRISRRALLAVAAGLLGAPAAAMAEPRHGLSAFGELKYPADFKHFEYVNPSAPKGGRMTTIGTAALETFDSFNGFILKGDPAQGLGLIYDSLMAASGDEPDAGYGLVAQSADVAADRMSVTFKLRPEARFADGSPVTAQDAVFTLKILKEKGHPSFRVRLRDVTNVEAIDPLTVRYTFTGTLVRDLPLAVAGLPVLPKAYYAGREFDQTTLDPPLGSGPYKIGDFKPGGGGFVSYKRRDDYWAKDLPVNVGRFNFDEIRFDYFRDRTAQLQALKAGDIDLREEFTSRDWATAYDIPAVKDGRLVKLTLPDETPGGAQGFFLNTRRSKLADIRVRKALGLAFDFEWTNKNLFYGLYTRTESFFENSDMKATGKPSPEELALLEPFKDKLPTEVFGEPYRPPVSDGSGTDRKLLREAGKLLEEAGYTIKDGKRINAKGEVLEFEYLFTDPVSERIAGGYQKSLGLIGVALIPRRVDPAQYERRTKSFDFDITTRRYRMALTPGIELQDLWGSDQAMIEGSGNLAGIRDPVIDALIKKIIEAKSRKELVTAARAADRVLRAGHYWVPQWFKAAHHIVYWDKFSRPAVKPKYDRGVPDTWWYDAEKAAKLRTN